MKVFVVIAEQYHEGAVICGVFSSLEKAEVGVDSIQSTTEWRVGYEEMELDATASTPFRLV